MKKTLLVSGIALTLSSNVFAASDARSVGMGGVGVATADYLSAPVHNPALAAKYKKIDDVGLMLPSVSATLNDSDEVYDKIDEIQDLINANDIANASAIEAKMQELNGKSATAQAQALIAIAIPNEYVSSTFFVSGRLDAIAALNYDASDAGKTTGSFNSFAAVTGVAVIDYGMSLARKAQLGDGTFYYGITPKMQRVESILYTESVDSFDDDDFDADKYMKDETNFNMDLGFAYAQDDFTYGLTIRDLISKSYDTIVRAENSGNVQGTYKIQPVATVGVSYGLEYIKVAADIDLNKSERMTSLSNVNFDTDNDDTQNAGVGAEFDAWRWAQLRVGYQWDLQDNLDPQYTAGIGLSPFDTLHIDVSGSYGGDSQYGAAIDLAFMF